MAVPCDVDADCNAVIEAACPFIIPDADLNALATRRGQSSVLPSTGTISGLVIGPPPLHHRSRLPWRKTNRPRRRSPCRATDTGHDNGAEHDPTPASCPTT